MLVDLADHIPTASILRLALKLGFTASQANDFKDQNKMYAQEGTRRMLLEWREKKSQRKIRRLLAIALHEAQLKRLAEQYFPEINLKE